MTKKEVAQVMIRMAPELKERLHSQADSLGMSDNAFVIQSIQKALGERELTSADIVLAIKAIEERLDKAGL